MSQLDVLKEKIAYLKLWLGIIVVTDISLVGWLLGNYTVASWALIVGDVVAISVVSLEFTSCTHASRKRSSD